MSIINKFIRGCAIVIARRIRCRFNKPDEEWNHFDPIKDIPNGVCLTGFYSNYPTVKMMQDIFSFMDEHQLKPLTGAVYDFENIREACIALDEGKVNGKILNRKGKDTGNKQPNGYCKTI